MSALILRRKGSARETVSGIAAFMGGTARQINNIRFARPATRRRPAVPVPDVLIRWGCQAPSVAPIQINTVEMQALVNDKPASRRALIAAKVAVPQTFFTKAEALAANVYPLIGRRAHHSQGLGMYVSRTADDLRADVRSAYWSAFIPKDREYRLYTFFGKVLGVSEKIPHDREAISWNASRDNGVFETVPWTRWPLDVCLLALKATKACGVDFSAVDIIKQGQQSYVLELNNAPTCSEYRQRLFARAFNWLIAEIARTGAKPVPRELPEVIKTYKSMIHKAMYGPSDEDAAPESRADRDRAAD